uniref:HAT C-terminal dimerisation domain-containing protein n=1 Tax=Daphnia galeata TaxID=27404 RepID=A0A8J2WJL6_9CRUS|nr:unnamed protein product [Daphnia galeata]
MVANTFLKSIPGWHNEEDFTFNEHASADYDDSRPSTSASNIQDRESIETLWLLLQELGISFSEAGVHDDEDGREYRYLEIELEEHMPSHATAPDEFHDPEAIAVIALVSKLVNSARKSWASACLKKNSTRWNSTLYELENFLKAIEADPTLLTRLNAVKKHGSFSAYQQILFKEIIAILKPFEAASNDFQAYFETIGNVISAYLGLMNALSLTIKDRNGVKIANPTSRLAPVVKYCKGFVAGLRESLERRSIFDPRFRCAWIRQAGLNEKAVLNAVSSEIEIRCDLLRSITQDAVKPSSTRKRRLSQGLYSTVIELPKSRSLSGRAKVLEEFEIYLKEPIIPMEVLVNPMDPDSDLCVTKPLEYWKSNQCRFSMLSEIGRDVVSDAASSGSVERAFSVASYILTARRAAMKPDLFVKLMLIKCNAGLKVGLRDAVACVKEK